MISTKPQAYMSLCHSSGDRSKYNTCTDFATKCTLTYMHIIHICDLLTIFIGTGFDTESGQNKNWHSSAAIT